MTPLQRVLDLLRERGEVKLQGKEWRCLCPAHDDTTPSLDVTETQDGRVLLCCRSKGCSAAAITSALRLTLRDLFPEGSKHSPSNMSMDDRIVAKYTYRDEKGNPLFQACRLWAPAPKNKEFVQRRQVNGAWQYKLGDSRRVLYRLPELLAADPSKIVYVPEGEKDVENLRKCGLIATCNAMGAGKWKPEYAKSLAGRHVVILADNDEPGEAHAKTVRASLIGVAASAKIVRLPGLPEKGDVSDWIAEQEQGSAEAVDYAAIGADLERLCAEYTEPVEAAAPQAIAKPDPSAEPPKKSAAEIIHEHYHATYRPVFRRRASVVSITGDEISRVDATCGAPSSLIAKLSLASDAKTLPKSKIVDMDSLPSLFKKWAPTAWMDMFSKLPDEDAADLDADTPAAEAFGQLVRDALLTPLTLGDVIGHTTLTQVERRSVIGWCIRFAKPGQWKPIRDYAVWCRRREDDRGEEVLQVAVRHELFGQLRADRRLIELSATKWAKRARKYGIGESTERERPAGEKAVVLSTKFVADLTAGIHDDSE